MYEGLAHQEELVSSELKEQRTLTEVQHLLDAMHPDGYIPGSVLADVKLNLSTAVMELSMPYAVSESFHRAEYHETEEGHYRRMFMWLGRSAIATGGHNFHFSEAARSRVEVETAEAIRDERELAPGIAHLFISPKMSQYDAPEYIAKAEHLADEDSIRVSYAVTNTSGDVIGRRLVSLLVRDIPLNAWVSMLSDPHNIFGRSIEPQTNESALSVMELFDQLDLPEESIPNGPVDLVAAVMPYLTDPEAKASVAKQLAGFRADQTKYRIQAEKTSQEWLNFDIELAKSLKDGFATRPIESFIARHQFDISAANVHIIRQHASENGWVMSRTLAAALESSMCQILNSTAGLATDNEEMIKQVNGDTLQQITQLQNSLNQLVTAKASRQEIERVHNRLETVIARQNIRVGGGCPGIVENNFMDILSGGDNSKEQPSSDKKDWKWTIGKCQIKACTSPTPTEVGPCSVCRNCQHKFDIGEDPTKVSFSDIDLSLLMPKDKDKSIALGSQVMGLAIISNNKEYAKAG